MPRFHLFEFEDLTWFPQVIRNGMMDFLSNMINRLHFYKPAAALIKNTLLQTGNNEITELCAGAGGGVLMMKKYLEEINCNPRIILSDKFPNIPSYKMIRTKTKGEVDFMSEPVDALGQLSATNGVHVIFSALHHFKPREAASLLSNASKTGIPICIFDSGTTNWWYIFPVILIQPITFLLLTPFFRPFRWSNLVFTYLIPLIPLCTVWDGCVSVMRFYSVKEMKELTIAAQTTGYLWEVGQLKNPIGIPVNFITGIPQKSNSQV